MATTTRTPMEVHDALRAMGFGSLSMDKGTRVTLEIVRLARERGGSVRPGETVFRRDVERKPGMTDLEFIRLCGAESEMMSAAFLAGLEVERLRARGALVMVRVIYPERRTVSEETVIGWARDAVANGEAESFDGTLDDAMELLEDIGEVTFARGNAPEPADPLESWAERYDALNGAPESEDDR
jgi:hypothetical protein